MRTRYIVIWIMVIREINNKIEKKIVKKPGTLYTIICILYSININVNTHTIYNIFCIYQYHPMETVQLNYWIHVDKNRI